MANTKSGYADILIGLQYGDEGKARIVDLMAKNYDVIARFNGGANAGHTIETNEGLKVALNQIPSGIFYPEKALYIGSGCVVNIEKIAQEIEKISKLGVKFAGRLHISCQASVVQPHHILIDSVMGKTIGTTKNGIGPCYADKAYRMHGDRLVNIRLGDLLEDSAKYFQAIKENLLVTQKEYDLKVEDPEKAIDALKAAFELIREYIQPDTLFLEKKVEEGARVLFEGAQSVMLDVSKGSVPYVTSSSTVAGAAFVGGDLSPNYHRKTIGIAKAIMSRVGHGPFASEFGGKKSEEYCMATEGDGPKFGKMVEAEYDIEKLLHSEDEFGMGKAIRYLSGEYGTVTTRPRRIGMFDLMQLKYAIKMNGVSELIVNKCDLLNVYSRTAKGKIPLVVGYKLDGKEIDYVPGSEETYYKVEPMIEYKDGFEEDVSAVRDFEKLPEGMKKVVERVEEICGCKMVGLGVGPERDQFVII